MQQRTYVRKFRKESDRICINIAGEGIMKEEGTMVISTMTMENIDAITIAPITKGIMLTLTEENMRA